VAYSSGLNMMIDGLIESAFNLGQVAIEKLWPDPTKRAEEMRKLEQLRQDGDVAKLNAHVQLMLAQAKINLADAQSNNWFQSGWRPAIGWVGAISLALMYIPKAIMMTFVWSWQNIVMLSESTNVYQVTIIPFPDLGAGEIIGLLGSMLGVAILRSRDKEKGTNTK
jgi:hypothetical protein